VADFQQHGTITTLHNLTQRPLAELEAELVRFSERSPLGLVLPSLYSELEGPALAKIVDELCDIPYLGEIVIGLDRADASQFSHAKEYFARLPQHHRVLWHDGPRARAIEAALQKEGLAPAQRGKGRNVWYCFGYLLASQRSRVIALHDCDIVTYERSLLARLLYPVACPSFSFFFCKGYYARAAGGRLHGRVTRLFVTPLIRALQCVVGEAEYLEFLDSFRYPLAGEFSLNVDVLEDLRIPSDWGLEIGLLSEVQSNYSRSRLCEVAVADVYDHKHQKLSTADSADGLSRMSCDIARTLFLRLASQGHGFSTGTFRTIKTTYHRIAIDFVESYYNDAQTNGLTFDRHAEEQAVEVFAESIVRAGELFLHSPMETSFIPSWNRVRSALPGIARDLLDAAEADNA